MNSIAIADLPDATLEQVMSFIEISEPRKTHDSETGIWRVEWDVAGHPVSLESSYELDPSTEAIAAAFFLHGQRDKTALRLLGPLDQTFAQNLKKLAVIADDYWGFSPDVAQQQTVSPEQQLPVDREAMFFTCGVDSFYTLRTNLQTVSTIINVSGYDIALDDAEREAKARQLLERTADTLGLTFISVRVSLRDHPLFASLHWGTTHIAALALVAHCLKAHVSRVRIASSDGEKPWGSTVEMDKLWSSSDVQLINNEQVEGARFEKVRTILDWPIAQQTLKVCWENRTDALNCGVCEKCVRTQALIVAAGGDLADFQSFPEVDLVEAIDGVHSFAARISNMWQKARDEIKNGEQQAAIDRLFKRAHRQHRRDKLIKLKYSIRYKLAQIFR